MEERWGYGRGKEDRDFGRRERGGGEEKERGGEEVVERERWWEEEERGRGRENSNSKTLILKNSSVRSIWTYLTARERERGGGGGRRGERERLQCPRETWLFSVNSRSYGKPALF